MTTEPDTERLLLLAQVALEGVRMTPEAQELASIDRLKGILSVAIMRSSSGTRQASYNVEHGKAGHLIVPLFRPYA